MSEYNPFDMAPPVVDKLEEKPKPEVQAAAAQPAAASPPSPLETDFRYAPPPASGPMMPPPSAPYPPAPGLPGRAPLAGRQPFGGVPPPSTRPSMPGPAASTYAGPPPQAAPPPPPPSMDVKYDLAGNPLPSSGPPPPAAPPPPDMGVKYDLAGNPLPVQYAPAPASMPQAPSPSYGGAPSPSYGGAPSPYGQPPASVYPPAPAYGGGGPGFRAQAANTSGSGMGDVPPEIDACRWHWGAFFLTFWWAAFHKAWDYAGPYAGFFVLRFVLGGLWSALSSITLLGISIRAGFNGHLIAWRNCHFPGGVQQFFAVQRAWAIAGFIYFGTSVLVCVFFFAFILAILTGSYRTHHSTYGSGNSSGYGSGYGPRYNSPDRYSPGSGSNYPGTGTDMPPSPSAAPNDGGAYSPSSGGN